MSEQNPFLYVAEEVRAINDYVKEHIGEQDCLDKVNDRVKNLVKFAEKNEVPLKISVNEIFEKVINTEIGETEDYEDSYYEDSYSY